MKLSNGLGMRAENRHAIWLQYLGNEIKLEYPNLEMTDDGRKLNKLSASKSHTSFILPIGTDCIPLSMTRVAGEDLDSAKTIEGDENNKINIQFSQDEKLRYIFAEIHADLLLNTVAIHRNLRRNDSSILCNIELLVNGQRVEWNDSRTEGLDGLELFHGDHLRFSLVNSGIYKSQYLEESEFICQGPISICVAKCRSKVNSKTSPVSQKSTNCQQNARFHESMIISETLYSKFDEIIRLQSEIETRSQNIASIVEQIETHHKVSSRKPSIGGETVEKMSQLPSEALRDEISESSDSSIHNCAIETLMGDTKYLESKENGTIQLPNKSISSSSLLSIKEPLRKRRWTLFHKILYICTRQQYED